jgi:predicted ATPase
VTDVADALILQRLFTGLWERGAVVIATSNRPPDELYWNGIQRDRFLPFIELIKQRCDVVSMWDSDTDYRLVQKKLGSSPTVYFVGKESRQDFDQLFYALANGSPAVPTFVTSQGRQVPVPQAVPRRGLARFSFEDLCQKSLGVSDYLQIGQTFHTVFVERVPVLSMNEINWVRRFITFVDAMYESKVKLILQAAAARPNEILARSKEQGMVHDEFFAFDRTVSRLEEMQSERYLKQRWAGSQARGSSGPPLKPSLGLIDPSLGDSKRLD